jgi:hypothetical protein
VAVNHAARPTARRAARVDGHHLTFDRASHDLAARHADAAGPGASAIDHRVSGELAALHPHAAYAARVGDHFRDGCRAANLDSSRPAGCCERPNKGAVVHAAVLVEDQRCFDVRRKARFRGACLVAVHSDGPRTGPLGWRRLLRAERAGHLGGGPRRSLSRPRAPRRTMGTSLSIRGRRGRAASLRRIRRAARAYPRRRSTPRFPGPSVRGPRMHQPSRASSRATARPITPAPTTTARLACPRL